MTPLAHSFAKDLTRPIAKRLVDDRSNLLPSFDRMHSFDCTAIHDAIESAMAEEDTMGDTIHYLIDDLVMPSEIAWLEFGKVLVTSPSNEQGLMSRLAVVAERQGPWLKVDLAMHHHDDGIPFTVSLGRVRSVPLFIDPKGFEYDTTPAMQASWTGDGLEVRSAVNRFVAMAVLSLDIIGQPSLSRLITHAPHKGLERQLLRQGVGKYPLLAWHEVVIKPQDRPLTDEEAEGHLTGRKCLHFVRGHRRRYRDGRETVVTHHWRGDPALGMQRTRYRVEPPRKVGAR